MSSTQYAAIPEKREGSGEMSIVVQKMKLPATGSVPGAYLAKLEKEIRTSGWDEWKPGFQERNCPFAAWEARVNLKGIRKRGHLGRDQGKDNNRGHSGMEVRRYACQLNEGKWELCQRRGQQR